MTDDEKDLFRRALADAKPLRVTRRAAEVIRKPVPRARFARADEASVLRESLEADIDDTESHSGESLRFHRPCRPIRSCAHPIVGFFPRQIGRCQGLRVLCGSATLR